MKGQVLHLMELHFFMEGAFEVNVFDLLLIKIYPANRLPSEAGRKENWRAKLGLELFLSPRPRRFSLSLCSTWVACVQTPPPLTKNRRRGGGSVHRVHLGACPQAYRKGAPFI